MATPINNGTRGGASSASATEGKSGWSSFMRIWEGILLVWVRISAVVRYIFFDVIITPTTFFLLSLLGALLSFLLSAQAYTSMLATMPSLSVWNFPIGNGLVGYSIALAIQITEIVRDPNCAPWMTRDVILRFTTSVSRRLNNVGTLDVSDMQTAREKSEDEVIADWGKFGKVAYLGDLLIALQQITVTFVVSQAALSVAGSAIASSFGVSEAFTKGVVSLIAAACSVAGPEIALRSAVSINRARMTVEMAAALKSKDADERNKRLNNLRRQFNLDEEKEDTTIASVARRFDLAIVMIAFGDIVWSMVKTFVSANTLFIVSGLLTLYCFLLEFRLFDLFLDAPFLAILLVASISSMVKILPTAYKNFPEFTFARGVNIAISQDLAAGNSGLAEKYKKARSSSDDKVLKFAGWFIIGVQLCMFFSVQNTSPIALLQVQNILPLAFFLAMSIFGTLFFINLGARASLITPDLKTMEVFNKAERKLRDAINMQDVVTYV